MGPYPKLLILLLLALLWSPLHAGKRPPARSLYASAFARDILKIGKGFRRKLPKGWNMEWSPSIARTSLRWMARGQQGFRIRFSHDKKKVYVPVPFPLARKGKKNIQKVPLRCSLHFFPRTGQYTAQRSRVARLAHGKFLTVLAKAIVFQADRFQAMEYPCPALVALFLKHVKHGKGKVFKPKKKALRRGIQKARRYAHYLHIHAKTGARLSLPKLAKAARVKTVVVVQKQFLTQITTIWNRK